MNSSPWKYYWVGVFKGSDDWTLYGRGKFVFEFWVTKFFTCPKHRKRQTPPRKKKNSKIFIILKNFTCWLRKKNRLQNSKMLITKLFKFTRVYVSVFFDRRVCTGTTYSTEKYYLKTKPVIKSSPKGSNWCLNVFWTFTKHRPV